MTIEEILPGQVYRECDYRKSPRWIRVLEIRGGKVHFDTSAVSPKGPFDLVRRRSQKPDRFHNMANNTGFRLERKL